MSISFTIDVQKVSKSELILDTIAAFFGSDDKKGIAAALIKGGPSKALETIREATKPTHVVYDSVMDGVTTQGCRDLNDRDWKIGDPNIVWTPRHWNCRAQNRFVRLP